jgi:succinyl-CoA synthetase beta subunit
MNLHEHQAKELLSSYGAPIQRGIAAESVEDAVKAAHDLTAQTGTQWYVVKAQVHAGGRGKAGGVKLAKNIDELKQRASDI